MKNSKLKFVFLFVILCFTAGSFISVSADTVDYQEDFSSYPAGSGAGIFSESIFIGNTVPTIVATVGDHSNVYQLTADPGTLSFYEAAPTEPSTQITRFRFDAMFNNTDADGTISIMFQYDVHSVGISIDPATNRIMTLSAGSVDIGPLVYNTWYSFRFEIDNAANTFDVYINGVMPANGDDIPLNLGAGGPANLMLFIGGLNTGVLTLDIDNIRIVSIDPPPAVNPATDVRGNYNWIFYLAGGLVILVGGMLVVRKKLLIN